MCDTLAKRYSTLKGLDLSNQTTSQQRADFLRSDSYWTCLSDGKAQPLHTPAEGKSKTLAQRAADCDTERKKIEAKDTPKPNGVSFRTDRSVLNLYVEDGFLPWVNELGMKCIHHVTGAFNGIHDDPTDEKKYGRPRQAQGRKFPTTCSAECFRVTENSDQCFACVAQVVLAQADACPAFQQNNITTLPEVTDTLKKAVSCKGCLAQQAIQVNKHGATELKGGGEDDADTVQELKNIQAEYCWKCVEGYRLTHPFVKTTEFALIMVFVSLLILVGCVVVTVILVERSRRPKITTKPADATPIWPMAPI